MTTIITKNSSTTGAAPAAGDLTQGELAVNVTDRKLYTKNSSNAVVSLGADLATNNPIGTNNVTLGSGSGAALTTGSSNTFIGTDSGKLVTTAVSNTALGHEALRDDVIGSGNTAIGKNALNKCLGNFNCAIGFIAGNAATLAYSNTFLGDSAGANVTTGQGNVNVGNASYASSPTVSYEVTLGGSGITALRCNVTSISSLSDARDKTDIVDTAYGVDFLNTLQPRQFKWATRDGSPKDGKTEQGFIAQELLEAAGVDKNKLNLVYESNPEKLEATAGNLIPILVKAIQELSARVTELENN